MIFYPDHQRTIRMAPLGLLEITSDSDLKLRMISAKSDRVAVSSYFVFAKYGLEDRLIEKLFIFDVK